MNTPVYQVLHGGIHSTLTVVTSDSSRLNVPVVTASKLPLGTVVHLDIVAGDYKHGCSFVKTERGLERANCLTPAQVERFLSAKVYVNRPQYESLTASTLSALRVFPHKEGECVFFEGRMYIAVEGSPQGGLMWTNYLEE